MAEASDTEAAEKGTGEARSGKGEKSKLIFIVAGIAFLLVLGGGGAYFLGVFGGGDDAEAAKRDAAKAEQSHGGAGEETGGGSSRISLDPFVVNLADEGAQRYLKVSMVVEFFSEDPPQVFMVRRPEVRDLVLTLLSSKYVADVRTIEGKQQLRDEIAARINRVVDDDVVKAIYFAEFIVQ